MLRLLLVAAYCVLHVDSKCYGRDNRDGMCARIKENQFQIQGVQIVEASQKIHEDIEASRYQPRREIRRQAANYQDETLNYPQVGGGTVGQIDQSGSGVGVVGQSAPSLGEGTQGGGGEQTENFGRGDGGYGGEETGGSAQQGQLSQGGGIVDQLSLGATGGAGGGGAQVSAAQDGADYAAGPPGKKGRGKKGKKGQQPPGVAPSGGGEAPLGKGAATGFISNVKDPHNIRQGKQGSLASAIVGKYYYAPKQELPLPKCFHNPTGYVCCNFKLNSIMESTYKELRKNPKFNSCNVGVIATAVQKTAEKEFNTPFESIAALEDFAQKVHFSGDMVCKIEIDGKYILAYATPYHAEKALDPEVLAGHKKIEGDGQVMEGSLLGPRHVRSVFI
ncbi:hypothetical protein QR680_006734 [Steinernema hermaphroditum]|uniref:Ground-like domain-containing protein n=1 Tax=Steinernema hermaphroditum TaxID=289476 RepID=A0AA39HYV0_9BILA|nr:hypothetical protein QR680_006734 [Steinernema hermaphroditum]